MKRDIESNYRVRENQNSQWFCCETTQVMGNVLLVHGLNQKPSTWKDLIVFLNSIGLNVYRLSLKGHRGLPLSDMHEVNCHIWEQDITDGYREIEVKFGKFPTYLVAYSLGGLVSMVVQLRGSEPFFTKQVLLAPALSLKPYTRLALPLCHLFGYLPSRSTREYIANPEGTTSEAYKALFSLEKDLSKVRDYSLVNTPTLVLMRSDDELISFPKTKQFIESNQLKNWKLISLDEVEQKKRGSFSYKHLIVDKRSSGPAVWKKMTTEMQSFLT